MKIDVSSANGWMVPSSLAALSSSRNDVVPTAMIRRPPFLRAVFNLSARLGRDRAPLGVHLVAFGVVDLDRQKGPCPDMQRQAVDADTALAANACSSAGVKCRPAVGAATRAFIRREHGLVVCEIPLVRRALGSDVRRQRRAAEIGDGLIERRAVERE